MAENRDVAFDALLITVDRLLGEVFGEKAQEIINMDHSKCGPNHSHEVDFVPVLNDQVVKLLQIMALIVEILDDDDSDVNGTYEEVFGFWEALARKMPKGGTAMTRVAAKAKRRADQNISLLNSVYGGDPGAN